MKTVTTIKRSAAKSAATKKTSKKPAAKSVAAKKTAKDLGIFEMTVLPKRPPKAPTFRPMGARVLVLFPQSDWEVGEGGFILKTGLVGVGYRMDGMVVAVGTKDIPDGVSVGSTVYADPRLGDVLNIEGTRYHIMNCRDLLAVAEPEARK